MNINKISVVEGFQTSVNIGYDLHNKNKIKSFIPTKASIEVIEEIFLSTSANSTARARLLTGAYGRGKSHIILVLLSMLSSKSNKGYENLLSKIKEYNADLYDYIKEYYKSKNRLLPVVISGSSVSLTQSFMVSLRQTLISEGLDDIMPDTNFQAVINTIENWKNNYKATYNKFRKLIDVPVKEFVLRIEKYDSVAYSQFISIYPSLTSGSEFNPFAGFDVVDIYEKVNYEIKAKGYNGIFVVYDEFSKYLESSIENASISDVKLLQDFAEKCSRSEKQQLHLLLICHKDISNYIDDNLPKEKVDGWRGVSGRFIHMDLHNNFSQIYEVISQVILKNSYWWNKFKKTHSEKFNDLAERFYINKLFERDEQSDVRDIIEGTYPLHPVTTFILPRLSEKVAQNERTLFTFLSANEKNSLREFLSLESDEFSLLPPDILYDYFEPLIRKEPYTSEIHNIYKLTNNAIKKADNKALEVKIIKLLSLIYIVEQFEKYPPTREMIVEAFCDNFTAKEIDEALSNLLEKECVVYLKRSNNYLRLKESTGVEISVEINKEIENLKIEKSIVQIINEVNTNDFLYPVRYNDEHNMVRYFELRFIDGKTFLDSINFSLDTKSDGVLFAIIPNNKSQISKLNSKVKGISTKNAIFILPNEYVNITSTVYEFFAALKLRNNTDDELLADEYSIYVDDLGDVINQYVNSFIRPEYRKVTYYYTGEKYKIFRKAQLSDMLSKICEEVFPNTPIINNEAINRNLLSKTTVVSRTKIVEKLLTKEIPTNLGFTGNGQEMFIYRSVLLNSGIIKNTEPFVEINEKVDDTKINNIFMVINKFIVGSKKKPKSFKKLYDELTSINGGIGLKTGVIPIYIAIAIRKYSESLTITSGNKELILNADLLNSINDYPGEYYLKIDVWDSEKEEYIKSLQKIFSDYIIEDEYVFGDLSYLTQAMNRWYLSLPKYSKDARKIFEEKTKDIPMQMIKFINSVKQVELSPKKFILSDVFKIFGYESFNLSVDKDIKNTKRFYDKILDKLICSLIVKTKTIFGITNKKSTLTSSLKDWHDTLKPETLQHVFTGNENYVLETINESGNDERQLIVKLAKMVTSLRIEDWSFLTVDEYINNILLFKKEVEKFDSQLTDKNNIINSYKIMFVDEDGKENIKTFDKVEYSKRAILLKNDISTSIDEMGQSISEQEKRQILIEMLEKLC